MPTPKPDQVRIKIHATAATSSDALVRSLNLHGPTRIAARLILGIRRPRRAVLGLVLSGEIESVGADVRAFRVGEQVCGFEGFAFGAYAEYKCMAANGVGIRRLRA